MPTSVVIVYLNLNSQATYILAEVTTYWSVFVSQLNSNGFQADQISPFAGALQCSNLKEYFSAEINAFFGLVPRSHQ